MFDEQVLQNAHGQLSDLGPLLQGLGHLSEQQTHQEVVPAVLLGEAELQTLFCSWVRQEVSVHQVFKKLLNITDVPNVSGKWIFYTGYFLIIIIIIIILSCLIEKSNKSN